LKVQDDLGGSLGCDAADLRASRPAVTAFMVKGFPFFGVDQMINLAVADLMNLLAEGVADPIPEKVTDSPGFFHGLPILFPVFQLFPPRQAAYPHDGPGQRPAGFPHPGHSAGQRASGLEYLFTSHFQLFLQSRKNGLGSAEIGHVVLEGQLEDLIQKFLPIFRHFFLLERLPTVGFFNDDKYHSSDLKNAQIA